MRLRHEDHERKRAESAPIKPRYLLTGLLVCGKCSSCLGGAVVKERHGPVRYYRCKVRKELGEGCSGTTRSADALDTYITDMVLALLESDEMAGPLRQEEERGLYRAQRYGTRRNRMPDRSGAGRAIGRPPPDAPVSAVGTAC